MRTVGRCRILLTIEAVSSSTWSRCSAREVGELAAEPLQLARRMLVDRAAQGGDGRHDLETGAASRSCRASSSATMRSACAASRSRSRRFCGDHALQVVDVVQIARRDAVDVGIQVARHGDVDQEHGPTPAARMTSRDAGAVITKPGAAVEEMTMSAAASCASSSSKSTARPPHAAGPAPRRWPASGWSRRCARCRCACRCVAVSSLVSPAPSTSTTRRSSLPNTCLASSTATELTSPAARRWRSRCARACPTSRACRKSLLKTVLVQPPSQAAGRRSLSWATICASPTTIESRLAATRNRWAMAASP